jgi:hypothetical protein
MNHKQLEQVEKKAVKKRRFPIGWMLALLIPLIIVSSGLYAFSKLLYGFEFYSPVVELEKYVGMISEKDYAGAMAFIGLETSPFNRLEEYTAYFEKYYGETVETSVFTERKLRRTEDSRFYDLQINKKPVQEFKLTKAGETKLYFFNSWTVKFTGTIPTESVVIHTPPGVRITVNGTEVTADYKSEGSTFAVTSYERVKDDNKNIVSETYQVDGLIALSSVEAVTLAGEACEVTQLTDTDTTDDITSYLVTCPIPADQVEERKATAETIMKKYAEYIAKERSFGDLASVLYQNTGFYDEMKEFYNGWFTGHESFGYENLEFFGMESFDDTHCVVGVKFNYYVIKSGKRFDYDVKYYTYLLKVGDKWLLADISIKKKN